MGKIDTNKQQKESSLLKTAFEFFTTKGFSKTAISDIVSQAGVAKGTFYLYFKDKYDIRNRLVAHKSSQLFMNAVNALSPRLEKMSFEDKLISLIDNILNQLIKNQPLLTFISKNLSWGLFKNSYNAPIAEDDVDFREIYHNMLEDAPCRFRDPEIMLFMIIELTSSTCYQAILNKDPCDIEGLKPYLFQTVRLIIENHKLSE